MKIKFSKKFVKHYKKIPRKIQIAFDNRLKVFEKDKFHPQLNNHPLTGVYRNYRSINITGDWRAIYTEIDNGSVAYFILIDTHSNLYK